MDWFPPTLLATAAYGVMAAIQRVASARGLSGPPLLAVSATTVAVLASLGATFVTGWSGTGAVALHAAANGALFSGGTLALLAALRRASAATILPVAKLDGVLVVLIGVAAFSERPTPLQLVGIAAGLGVVAVLAWPGKGDRRPPLPAILLGAVAAGCYACSMSVGKLAAQAGPKLPYIALSYAGTALVAFALVRGWPPREALRPGVAIGALNFGGFVVLLHAFTLGPMALIQPIFASSMLVAILLAARVLHERITVRQVAALGLGLGAAVLIRLG